MAQSVPMAATTERNRIRELRDSRGWSQQELAFRTAISIQTVHRVEVGKSRGTPAIRKAIADALGFPVDEVFPSLKVAS